MQYKELNGAGTFTVKTGAGFLKGIQVNVATSAVTLQIFDSVTNAAPAIAGATAFAIPTASTFLSYDAHFTSGLTIVIGGTITAVSITVEYI